MNSGAFNPHQNININISYNLNNEKLAKSVTGKKINNKSKIKPLINSNPYDIEIKVPKKSCQNNSKKANEKTKKDDLKVKKKKEKPVFFQRNTFTPQMINDRKLYTEQNQHQNFVSTVKKQSKNNFKHHKSTQLNNSSKYSISSKKISFPKPKQIKTKNHNTSESIFPKRFLTQIPVEYITSQSIHPPPAKKKRAYSAILHKKDDKVVSKLLNMSLLSSELGGSQMVTSQRRENKKTYEKMLKQYMASTDMRMINKMEKDTPFFKEAEFLHEDITKTILKRNNISFEQLTRKIVTIQRLWRSKQTKSVLKQYLGLFTRATDRIAKNVQESQINPQSMSLQNYGEYFQDDNLLSSNPKVSPDLSLLEARKSEEIYSNDNDFDQNIKWIEENDNFFKEEKQQQKFQYTAHLNLKKYKQIIKNEIQSVQAQPKSLAKFKEEQIEQWNSLNKDISCSLNEKGGMNNKELLEKLIKQSNENKKWIEDEFISKQASRQNSVKEEFSKKNSIDLSELNSVEKSEQQKIDKESLKIININKPIQIMNTQNCPKICDDSFTEEEQYDNIKYQLSPNRPPVQLPLDKQWISNQLIHNLPPHKNVVNVVNNYLDCDLEGFGLSQNDNIVQISHQIDQKQQKKLSPFIQFDDESIGNKFQRANIYISHNVSLQNQVPKVQQNQENQVNQVNQENQDQQRRRENESSLKRINTNSSVNSLVQIFIGKLIQEFATGTSSFKIDISKILKRSHCNTQKMPVRASPPVQKIPGIPTSFSSIKQYLQQFIIHLQKKPQILQKVVSNINKDIGPTSLQILSYLRPQPQDYNQNYNAIQQIQAELEDDEGLFVIEADEFQQFQTILEERIAKSTEIGNRTKAFLNFWHRCIYESFNECLDYERPFSIEGKPYEWMLNTKKLRKITIQNIFVHLKNAETRLLDMTCLVCGIIFDKEDSIFHLDPSMNEQQRHLMNQQRLSRVLATELLETENSWVNYNDQMTELLVQIGRIIEQRIFFEVGSQIKKIIRRRKLVKDEISQQGIWFNLSDL